eukprot:365378-Chlamydomonas_euryale.AAC.15
MPSPQRGGLLAGGDSGAAAVAPVPAAVKRLQRASVSRGGDADGRLPSGLATLPLHGRLRLLHGLLGLPRPGSGNVCGGLRRPCSNATSAAAAPARGDTVGDNAGAPSGCSHTAPPAKPAPASASCKATACTAEVSPPSPPTSAAAHSAADAPPGELPAALRGLTGAEREPCSRILLSPTQPPTANAPRPPA